MKNLNKLKEYNENKRKIKMNDDLISFGVRISPDLHFRIKCQALCCEQSVQAWITEALTMLLDEIQGVDEDIHEPPDETIDSEDLAD